MEQLQMPNDRSGKGHCYNQPSEYRIQCSETILLAEEISAEIVGCQT